MLVTYIHAIVHYLAIGVELIGVCIITWGVVQALWRILMMSTKRFHRDVDLTYTWLRMRRTFGEIMLLGLQFLVAADIVLTISNPDLQTVGLLAAIVVIRIVLSVSLSKEIEGLAERDEEDKKRHPSLPTKSDSANSAADKQS